LPFLLGPAFVLIVAGTVVHVNGLRQLAVPLFFPAFVLLPVSMSKRRRASRLVRDALVAAQNSSPLTGVGDSFVMNMDREALGDIPLGQYQVRNTVTAFVPNEILEWNVGGVDQPPFGHVYGYRLEPRSDDATVVTLYVDWTGVRASSIRNRFPIVPAHMLEKSLDNLDRIVTSG
jgi:hypothetical protein